MTFTSISAAFLGILLLGCSAPQSKPSHTPGVLQISEGIPGYQHGVDRSLFSPGSNQRVIRENGYDKVVGNLGTFATRSVNGSVLALPDATSPIAKQHFSNSASDHNKRVLEYFLKAGLIKDQIAGIKANALLEGSGPMETAGDRSKGVVIAYYSILERAFDGIPIVDSFAWARLDNGGQVVSEAVYWPAIPSEILNQAKKLRATILDPVTRTEFLRHLPGSIQGGHVVIRHASVTVDHPFEAFASYDVIVKTARGGGFVRHFGPDGEERRLPQERVNLGKSSSSKRRTGITLSR